MEEILHQLIGSLSNYFQGFIRPRWCRISSINSILYFELFCHGDIHETFRICQQVTKLWKPSPFFLAHLFRKTVLDLWCHRQAGQEDLGATACSHSLISPIFAGREEPDELPEPGKELQVIPVTHEVDIPCFASRFFKLESDMEGLHMIASSSHWYFSRRDCVVT